MMMTDTKGDIREMNMTEEDLIDINHSRGLGQGNDIPTEKGMTIDETQIGGSQQTTGTEAIGISTMIQGTETIALLPLMTEITFLNHDRLREDHGS